MNCTSAFFQPQQRFRIPFSKDEDERLRFLVKAYGENNWYLISNHMQNRTVRQCRERWQLFLSSKIKHEKWTKEEDDILLKKYAEIGPKWKALESFFEGRTSYNIRNRWISLSKKSQKKFQSSSKSTLSSVSSPEEFEKFQCSNNKLEQQTSKDVNIENEINDIKPEENDFCELPFYFNNDESADCFFDFNPFGCENEFEF